MSRQPPLSSAERPFPPGTDRHQRRPQASVRNVGQWLLLSAVLWVGFSTEAHGQPVNAEVLDPNPFRTGFSGFIDGRLYLSRGNIDLINVGAGTTFQHQSFHDDSRAESWTPESGEEPPFLAQRFLARASARFAQREDTPFINQTFAHLRWTAMWHPWIGSDLFTQYQSDEFLRLQARGLAGGGVRAVVLHLNAAMAWVGSGYMFEYDRIDPASERDDPEVFEHRWTNYLTIRLALFNRTLLLQNTLYVQPRFERMEDFRLLEELEILARVNSVLAIGSTLSVMHDSRPPSEVDETDLRLVSSVRLSWQA